MDALAVGRGFADIRAGLDLATSGLSWSAQGEIGWHPQQNVDLFGFARASVLNDGPVNAFAGLGARFKF